MPKFSIIFATDNPGAVCSEWLCSQESEQIEVLIGQFDAESDCAHVINQAVGAASGEYVAIVDETLKVGIPHWLELFQTHLESSPYQVLGLSGFEQILQQDSMIESAVRVEAQVATVGGSGVSVYTPNSFFGDTHVKEVVIIDGRCMFARAEVFKQFSLIEGLADSQGSLVKTLFKYQVRLAVELAVAQGVLLGLPHDIEEQSCWRAEYCRDQSWDERYLHLLPLDTLQLSIWRFNLKGLEAFDPVAAQQLMYMLSREGKFRFQYRDHNRVSAVKGEHLALVVDHFNEVETLPAGDTFVLCGAGTGLLIEQLLDRGTNEVLVVEPEYGLICELLKYYDWSDALSEGRLRFMPLATGTPDIDEITLTQTTRLLQVVLDKNHQVTHVVRGYSYHLNPPWFRRIEQGLVQYLDQREAVKNWVNKRKQVYDVTVVSPKCEIFANLAQCFNNLGLRTRLFNVPDKADQLSVDKLRELLMQLSVDGSRLTVCRNRSFFETENVKKGASYERFVSGDIVNWWWDVPNVASLIDFNDPNCTSDNVGFAVDMLNVLPKGSHWLPPAANVRFCRERPASTSWLFDVTFVGQSRIPLLKSNLNSIVEFLNYQCGQLPEGISNSLLNPPSYRALYQNLCELESDLIELFESLNQVAPAHVYYFKYIFEMSKTAAFRVGCIETLFANQVPVAIFGDVAWVEEGIVPVEYYQGLIAPKDLPLVYQSSKVNLNLNFMQVSSTVNPKVFDILACSGAVVTDHRPELEVLFPEQDYRPLAFTSMDELTCTVKSALSNVDVSKWGQLGDMVRTKHTLMHRAQWFIDSYLSK